MVILRRSGEGEKDKTEQGVGTLQRASAGSKQIDRERERCKGAQYIVADGGSPRAGRVIGRGRAAEIVGQGPKRKSEDNSSRSLCNKKDRR